MALIWLCFFFSISRVWLGKESILSWSKSNVLYLLSINTYFWSTSLACTGILRNWGGFPSSCKIFQQGTMHFCSNLGQCRSWSCSLLIVPISSLALVLCSCKQGMSQFRKLIQIQTTGKQFLKLLGDFLDCTMGRKPSASTAIGGRSHSAWCSGQWTWMVVTGIPRHSFICYFPVTLLLVLLWNLAKSPVQRTLSQILWICIFLWNSSLIVSPGFFFMF